MTLTDQLVAANNASDTNWANALKVGALSGLLICTPQIVGTFQEQAIVVALSRDFAQDTYRTTEIGTDAEYRDLLTQFARVYEYLSTDTVDIDDEAHELLYSNLWQLYE